MRKVTVHHQVFSELSGKPIVEDGNQVFVSVAEVEVADGIDDIEALEFAWRWTNNIEGSWSGGGQMQSNPDYSSSVTVLEPLRIIDGQAYGHRSSMMGDMFEIDGRQYKVAMMGFEPC